MNDAENRNLIATNLDSNMMVEAAAGTGKTTGIVGRMVNLIASGRCKIENMAAATFTRKAAAELNERFQSAMQIESESPKRTDQEKSRLRESASRIEHAFVGTFHSFCSMILRERPIECGVDPKFREINESEDFQLREQAWQTFLKRLYSKGDSRLDRIYELGLKTDDLKKCYSKFVEFPDVDEWPHDAPPAVDIVGIKAQAQEYVQHMKQISQSFPQERGNDELMDRYDQIVRSAKNIDWRVSGQFFDFLELFDSTKKIVQRNWGEGSKADKEIAKGERDRFNDFRSSTVQPALEWWYRHRYEFVIELLEQAQEIYQAARRTSGGLDFQDLLLRSAEALKDQPALRAYFQSRFTHILVDEFQDTDPIQARILAYLTSQDNCERDWKKCVPVPGSLFLVGDPKQSIYRFRRADIVTYQQVKNIFESSGGHVVTLSKNFRSVDEVRTWVNPTFGTLLGYDESPYSPAAVDMEQGRVDSLDGELIGVETLLLPEGLPKEQLVAQEAELIAKHIAELIARKAKVSRTQKELEHGKLENVEPGDFLIVTRNKIHLGAYADALDRYKIANEVTGSKTFQNIPELKTILSCIEAVDDPKNPIPYVSVLRSSLFGFGDADLYELKRLGGRFSYSAPIPNEMNENLRQRFQDVIERFTKYRTWLRNAPFTSAFSKISNDLGLLAKCSAHRNGNMMAGGFLKAVEWLRAQSWDFDSTQDVVSYLEDLIEKSETDSCNVLPQSGTSVRIMNVHKAKGLEAPIVFLANAYGRNDGRKPHFHVDRSGDVTRGYLAITKPKGNPKHGHTRPIATPANWEQFQAEEKRFEISEDIRLLYVACTRASCKLIVSLAPSRNERFSFWKPLHEHVRGMSQLNVSNPVNLNYQTSVAAPSMTLSQLNTQVEATWKSLCEPSYAVVAAKSVAMKQSPNRPTWRASGNYGAQWGSAIHALLEIKMKQPNCALESFARQFADQFQLGVDRVEELVTSVSSVVESGIWARAKRSDRIYSEIPFESLDSSTEIPTVTRGVIDLCFEESDGWVIVDYKTDAISEADLEKAKDFYAPQLKTYAEFWQNVTNLPVAELGLYFTKINRYQIC